MNFSVISGDYAPRQFEFHPSREELIFGTINGEVCVVKGYDEQVESDVTIKSIGKNFSKSPNDAILGLCWFRRHADKFLVGSSRGAIHCGTVDDNHNNVIHRFQDYDNLTSVHLNCNDQDCLVSGYTNSAKIYDVETGAIISEYNNIHDNHINISRFATLTPTLFCTSSFDQSVKAWDTRMKPINPIYTLKCNSSIVMICFSHDDAFILASASDNEINQYLTVDGTTHTKFQVPKTGLDSNFTRAYYSSSCSYIFTGACEEPNVSILCATTGNLINRIECYPNRKHEALYIQSLRGHPRRDNNLCVLANYKCLADRELIYVSIPTYNDNYYIGSPDEYNLPPISSNMAFPTTTLTNIMRKMRAKIQEINDLDGKIQQKYIIYNTNRYYVDVSLLKSDHKDLNIGIRLNNELYLCHADILISRSTALLDMYQTIPSTGDGAELIDATMFHEYSMLDLSKYIPEHIAHLLPIVLDYLYIGEIAVEDLRRLSIMQYARIHDILLTNDCVTKIINDGSYWHDSLILLFVRTVSGLYHISNVLEVAQLNTILDRMLSQHITNVSVIEIVQIGRFHRRHTLVEAALYYLTYHSEFVDNNFISNEVAEDVLEQRRQCSVNIPLHSVSKQHSCESWSLNSIQATSRTDPDVIKLPLPNFNNHSTVLLNDNIMLVIGGMSDTQINYPQFPYAYNISSHQWCSISTKSCGNLNNIPSVLCNHCCVNLDPHTGIIICIGSAYISEQRSPIYLLDTKTLTWAVPKIENSSIYGWSQSVESPIERFRYSRHTVVVINPTLPIISNEVNNKISCTIAKAVSSMSDQKKGLYTTKHVAWAIIYGGYNESTRRISSEIHVLICAQSISNDLEQNESFYTWEWCYPKVHDMHIRQGAAVINRCDHAVTVVPLSDSQGGSRMITFGGYGGSNTYDELNDVKSLNCKSLSNLYWEKVDIIPDPVNGLPCERIKPSLEYVAAGNVVVLYGGSSRNTPLNDVWLLSIEHAAELLITFKWLRIDVGCDVEIPILPRFGHTSVTVNGFIYYFGGNGSEHNINSNVLVLQTDFDNSTFQWRQPMSSCLAATSAKLIVNCSLPDIHYDLRRMFYRIVNDVSTNNHRIIFNVYETGEDSTESRCKEYKCLDVIAKYRSSFITAIHNSTHFQQSNLIDIHEFDPIVVISVLIYFHTDIVCIDTDNILSLLEFAELYGFDHLRELCEGYLMRQVDAINVCAILNWASNWSSLLTLKKICYAVLMRNMVSGRVSNNIGFEALLEEIKEEFYRYYRDFNHAYK